MPKFVNLIAFLQKLILKEHVVVIMEFPDWVQVKMKILHIWGEYVYLVNPGDKESPGPGFSQIRKNSAEVAVLIMIRKDYQADLSYTGKTDTKHRVTASFIDDYHTCYSI